MVKYSQSAYIFFLGCICERTFHSTVLKTGSWDHLFQQAIPLLENNMNETWLFQSASKPRTGNSVKFGWWIPSHHYEICHFKIYHAQTFLGVPFVKKKKERAVTKINCVNCSVFHLPILFHLQIWWRQSQSLEAVYHLFIGSRL